MLGLPWGLEDPPESAGYPRISTGAHPRAVGTLGPEMLAWADDRALHPKRSTGWRWWQRLVAYRALEVDAGGRLVWDTVVVSGPRQVGKSWLERAVLAWRLHQGDRFGEEQSILHVAHKLVAAQEVWRPAARWASKDPGEFRVRWANGEQQIERSDGSRWLIQAASDGAGVSFSLSMALVDEAWRIARQVVDGAIAPTLAETESPQLWLVSTAGDSSSDLMSANRAAGIAMAEQADPGNLLLLEWSAPPDPDLDIDDPETWRDASPYWDARRAERVASARARATEVEFRQQWLNQWVPSVSTPVIEPAGWARLATVDGPAGTPMFGFDVAPDRSSAAVVACGGGILEVVRADDGVGWLADEIRRLVERWDPPTVVADPGGPAITTVEALRVELGDRLVEVKARELVAASGGLFDAIGAGSLNHRPHPVLDGAVAVAAKRLTAGAWTFARGNGGHVLVAAALAFWAETRSGNMVVDALDVPAIF